MPGVPVQLQMDRLSGDIWVMTRDRRGNICARHIGISQVTGQRRYHIISGGRPIRWAACRYICYIFYSHAQSLYMGYFYVIGNS